MPSGRSAPDAVTVTAHAQLEALPDTGRALFGADFFATLAWYRTVTGAALPEGHAPLFVTVSSGPAVLAVFPIRTGGGGAAALTTPYTCLWRPLLAPGLDAAARQAVWLGFGAWCRAFGTVRLDALDAADAGAIAAGLKRAGIVPLAFDHFGNWHETGIGNWPDYLAARPGELREALRRRGRRLLKQGGRFSIVTSPHDVEAGIAAYEQVYAKSWKTPEPFPHFNAALMRACARDGSLRLGLLHQGDAVLAAQFWVVRGPWAAVLKLAHDEAAKSLSPGTVLTGFMIEHLLTQAGVSTLDFGRGDDPYKASWTTRRAQRVGLVLANPARPGGLAAISRHAVGKGLRFLKKKKQKDF